ncbi:MAG: flavodoxin family protein [Candidatus Omnitrophica bacterium]|nr:flavodoxin family protein [Candidatus Omnitrophota bacterium]
MTDKKILIITGSPRNDGNTALLAGWFAQGAMSSGAEIETVKAGALKYKVPGCSSCRACQKLEKYECVIDDGAGPVLKRMAEVDAIVMATPLYFFSASAQIKVIFDRMFSLYKWDNGSGTMETPLKGKTLAVLASAYEDVGFDALEKPFILTAEYTGMKYKSLVIPNAGVSGDIVKLPGVREKVVEFGKAVCKE